MLKLFVGELNVIEYIYIKNVDGNILHRACKSGIPD